MPEYHMPGADTPRFRALPLIAQGYITAALFTENGKDGIPEGADFDSIAPRTLARMVIDCAQFERRAREILDRESTVCRRGSGDYTQDEQAGHDLWMTRNGHGVGFWEPGDWTQPAASELDAIAKQMGPFDLYAGDDGLIHH